MRCSRCQCPGCQEGARQGKRTKNVLGMLISWLVMPLGEKNAELLLSVLVGQTPLPDKDPTP